MPLKAASARVLATTLSPVLMGEASASASLPCARAQRPLIVPSMILEVIESVPSAASLIRLQKALPILTRLFQNEPWFCGWAACRVAFVEFGDAGTVFVAV